MTWLAICRDKTGSADLRSTHLAAHLAHVEAQMSRYCVAGPLKERDATVGSLLILDFVDEAEARAFVEADPYHAAGIWRDIEMVRFVPVAGTWVGLAT